MNTETNATIDEIMGQIGLHGDDCMRHDADAASASFEALRAKISAALDSQARQIEALAASLTLASGCLDRAGWEYIPDAIYGPVWKPPVNKIAAELRARLRERDAEIDALTAERDELRKRLDDAAEQEPRAWQIKQGGRVQLISNAEFVRASFDAAEMTPLYAPPVVAKPATPALGEWVEWHGGECPIADVPHEVKFRDGDVFGDEIAQSWEWRRTGSDFDIVAYRILP
jgi:hypothetical protein